jgi:hypothetical protein
MDSRGATTGYAPRRRLRPAALAALCAAVFLVGCKSSGGGGVFGRRSNPDGSLTSRGDPLLGGARIPPQNLPVPGREGYGARQRRDPLLGSPAGRDGSDERAGKDSAKGSAIRRPTKDQPFRPGPETTNAALAGHLIPDDTLSIGDRRTPGRTASQVRDDSPEYERAADELRRLGATVDEPVRADNGYEVRASVPLGEAGRVRQYTGTGPTAAAAVKQVVDQIRSDRGGRAPR